MSTVAQLSIYVKQFVRLNLKDEDVILADGEKWNIFVLNKNKLLIRDSDRIAVTTIDYDSFGKIIKIDHSDFVNSSMATDKAYEVLKTYIAHRYGV
ncbi:hypothetical protein KEN51_CDS0398 [Pseudomonas phage vB_Pae10145-KEN51]|uniref:PHIKZ041.2 n=4 Tax=Viruses TaxID=10239 RepID=L7SZ01_BPDPK|nr:hypothetical protein [Pseudomonas aeruginosa]YP_009639892.1 PHIKZ041.2 [Pseudomonas phage phiKZ]QJB22693.1 hypothetical protein fnug_50 [Pseudomonas phage fnug]QOV07908.1 hypothetical protein [Pseudomonas phage vB_PaeM_kmuB]QXN68663.1 hypothetical protein [Pseudomonas phage PA7]UNI71826.1 hypothetical protein Churi01_gp302 [Pseudomonas phage Churi01]UXD83391.1 hypothetical protein NP274_00345 [Pseudomonas phage Koomba boorn-mokiny kep-wari Wadjak 1]UXD83637.1 hypothetical protein NP274_00